MPKDDGGKLGRVKITVVGKDDKEKKVIKELCWRFVLERKNMEKTHKIRGLNNQIHIINSIMRIKSVI